MLGLFGHISDPSSAPSACPFLLPCFRTRHQPLAWRDLTGRDCLLHKCAWGAGSVPGTSSGWRVRRILPPASSWPGADARACCHLKLPLGPMLLIDLFSPLYRRREFGKSAPTLLRRKMRFPEVNRQSLEEEPIKPGKGLAGRVPERRVPRLPSPPGATATSLSL